MQLSPVDGYEDLERIFVEAWHTVGRAFSADVAAGLTKAYDQSARGKGNARHAQAQAWHEQPIIKIQDLTGIDFALGQVIKKLQESERLADGHDQAERMGACVYLAAAIHWGDQQGGIPSWLGDPTITEKDLSESSQMQDIFHFIHSARTFGNWSDSRILLLRALTMTALIVSNGLTDATVRSIPSAN